MLRHGFFIEWLNWRVDYKVFLACNVYNASEINPEMQDV